MSEKPVLETNKNSKSNLGELLKEGGPGRPKGSVGGRQLSLMTLDKILSKVKNQARLAADLQKSFDNNPLTFMKTFIMPLLPKQTEVSGKGGERLIPYGVEFSDENIKRAVSVVCSTPKPS